MQNQISAWGNNETKLFFELTPERILDAVEAAGYSCTGRCCALNSMENRVYELEINLNEPANKKSPWQNFIIAKFYRPERWTKEQIDEEHQFLLKLQEYEIPVVAPLRFEDGSTLREMPNCSIFYTLFPKVGGRSFAHDELDSQQYARLGRLLARVHNVGAITPCNHRITLSPATYIEANSTYLLTEGFIPPELQDSYRTTVSSLLQLINPMFINLQTQATHGDFHLGNILWGNDGPFVVDFDDMVRAPAVQDLWLLAPARDSYSAQNMNTIIEAYSQMREFSQSTLKLIEPLRTMRMIHFSAWIARRWKDPAFTRAFPYFGTPSYWQEHLSDIREQFSLIQESTWM